MFGHHLLNTRPDFVRGEPVQTQDAARFYEGILKSQPDCVYVKARLAISYNQLGATGSAIELGQEVQAQLADMDIQASVFDSIVDGWEATLQAEAANALAVDISATTSEPWKPTKDRSFPAHLPIPLGYEALKSKWRSDHGCERFRGRLLIVNAIETNHIEHTFLLTMSSAEDLIRRGVARGAIEVHHESEIQDPDVVRSILNDTLAAYDIIDLLSKKPTPRLSPEKISEIHSTLMSTARFHGRDYVPPGDTRTVTQRTVYINTRAGRVKFCPYTLVDRELMAICESAKVLMKNMTNPFTVASWLHLVLARCHPFDDGNGRVTRLVASLPLLIAGYPPISLSLEQRDEYFRAIGQAANGNHVPMMECIFDGTKAAIKTIEELRD